MPEAARLMGIGLCLQLGDKAEYAPILLVCAVFSCGVGLDVSSPALSAGFLELYGMARF